SQPTLSPITPHVIPSSQKPRIPLTLAPPAITPMHHEDIQRSQRDVLHGSQLHHHAIHLMPLNDGEAKQRADQCPRRVGCNNVWGDNGLHTGIQIRSPI
ncbi:hypothetical protein PIB30_115608, partial [Stylosanthes scabra]|nr:hypothetical protein [Stylosanthes scabra]